MNSISLIIPLYNEAENISLLHAEIIPFLDTYPGKSEVIYVDDGSKDTGLTILRELAHLDKRVRVIALSRNYGQTAAMGAGVEKASGEVIVMLDADLQNDPADIPSLLQKLAEGYDVVSGWRKVRYDEGLRVWVSKVANKLISKITRVQLDDYGCTLKVYRAEVVKKINFYGEIHRLLPAYAAWHGARIAQVEVNHRPRKFGHSKYGFSRIFKVVMDLLVVKFMIDYSAKPIYFFGYIGCLSLVMSFLSFVLAVFLRLHFHISFIQTPLLLLTVLLFMVGIQFFSMGLLADLILRNYYRDTRPYSVREAIGYN
jgi:dolichol-phosphate mannosyltransferase